LKCIIGRFILVKKLGRYEPGNSDRLVPLIVGYLREGFCENNKICRYAVYSYRNNKFFLCLWNVKKLNGILKMG